MVSDSNCQPDFVFKTGRSGQKQTSASPIRHRIVKRRELVVSCLKQPSTISEQNLNNFFTTEQTISDTDSITPLHAVTSQNTKLKQCNLQLATKIAIKIIKAYIGYRSRNMLLSYNNSEKIRGSGSGSRKYGPVKESCVGVVLKFCL